MNNSITHKYLKYPLISKINKIWGCIIAICILSVLFSSGFISENIYRKNYSKPEAELVWTVNSAENIESELILPYTSPNNLDYFTISTVLPELNSDSMLILKCRFSVISAKIDNKIIFATDEARIRKIKTNAGRNYCFIPVGDEFSNKKIDISIQLQASKPYKSSLSYITLSSKNTFFINNLRQKSILIVLCIILLLCSFGSFTFFLLSYFSNKHRVSLNSKSLFWLSIISILAVFWTISDSHILGVFTEEIVLDGLITYFSLTIIPIAFVHLFQSLYNNNLPIKIFKFFTELNCVLQFSAFLLGIKDFPEMLIYTHIICFIEIIFCIIYTITDRKFKNNTEKLILYIGNCGFAIFIAIVIVMYRVNRDGNYINYFIISLIIYCSMQIAICGIRLTKSTKRQAALHEAEKFALTDQLTKLENRRAYSIFKKNINSSKLPPNLNVIYFDLNGLKETNDTLGHSAGDELIVGFTDIVKKVFYDAQLCCRMGGDEFLVICRTDKESVKRSLFFFDSLVKNWHGKLVRKLSVSYGYASVTDFPRASFDELVKKADSFMYIMKKGYYKAHGRTIDNN